MEFETMKSLPKKFEHLAPFVAQWAVSSQNERQIARRSATTDQITAFYNAIFPVMPDILQVVDRYPLGSLPDDHRTLFEMVCSMAEIAPHVELYRGSPQVPNAFEESRMIAGHGSSPTWDTQPPSG